MWGKNIRERDMPGWYCPVNQAVQIQVFVAAGADAIKSEP